jgi:UDP-N-acetylglucosamine:LPS N-acetylglucosamine transferase
MLHRRSHRSKQIQASLDKALEDESPHNKGDVDVLGLGFVTNMAQYMVASDVLVSKAGPGTIAEAAAVGLPIMLTRYVVKESSKNDALVLARTFSLMAFASSLISVSSQARRLVTWMSFSRVVLEITMLTKRLLPKRSRAGYRMRTY